MVSTCRFLKTLFAVFLIGVGITGAQTPTPAVLPRGVASVGSESAPAEVEVEGRPFSSSFLRMAA